MKRPSTRAAALLLGALVLTGCGSTVQLSSTGGALSNTASGDGLGLDGSGVSSGDSTTSPDGATNGPTSAGADGSGSAPGSQTPGDAPTSAGSSTPTPGSTAIALPPAGTSGRGYTAKTITVGVIKSSSSATFAAALGVSGDGGDLGAQYAAVTKYINANGGVAGRELKLVVHDIDFATAVNNPSQASAEICTAFTQDAHVFAVLNPLPYREQHDCLGKANTPMVDGGGNTPYLAQSELDRYSNLLFGAGVITAESMAKSLVQSLLARKFLTGWNTTNGTPGNAPVKIGLLFAESPDATNVANLERKYLKEAGFTIADTVSYSATVQAGLAATQSAILKFKAEGITHVFGASVFFLQGAQQQNYRPRYVLAPGVGRLYAANSPALQMRGSMTIGWTPLQDVNAAQSPGDVSPATATCRSVMKGSGLNTSNEDGFAQMLAVCDAVFSFADALKLVTNPSNAALKAGIEGLGTTWRSAQTFLSTFSATRHASASAYRDLDFNYDCKCMKYTSGNKRTA